MQIIKKFYWLDFLQRNKTDFNCLFMSIHVAKAMVLEKSFVTFEQCSDFFHGKTNSPLAGGGYICRTISNAHVRTSTSINFTNLRSIEFEWRRALTKLKTAQMSFYRTSSVSWLCDSVSGKEYSSFDPPLLETFLILRFFQSTFGRKAWLNTLQTLFVAT